MVHLNLQIHAHGDATEADVQVAAFNNEERLAHLGYEQELKRSFGLFGMVGFSFAIVSSWTSLGGTLIVGITSGGPPVMVWSWLGISFFSLMVAYSFAEMCSAFPTAGGQYSWVAMLAPKKYARGAAWITGWFMCTGNVAMGAVGNFVTAYFILGMANLNNPSLVIERWHVCLLSYLLAMTTSAINILIPKYLNALAKFAMTWNILSFFVVVITILACNSNKQSSSFVFSEFQNNTGFSSPGMGVMIGLLQTFFGMCCYDAPAHMTEEMVNPSKEAPQAIILSVIIGSVTGFIFLIAAFFCVGDLEATASTPTGVPLIQIFLDSTSSVQGATVLSAMTAIVVFFSVNGLMTEASRGLYAFARDHGLPFSTFFRKVDRKSQIPVNAILLCGVVQAALNSIYFASYEGFSTVISIATFGFYLSFAMPLFVRLWSICVKERKIINGPYYSLGKWGPWINLVSLLFLAFAGVDFNFPQVGPVTADNMNYGSVAFGVIALISVLTWVIDGRKNFTGPDVNALVAIDDDRSTTEAGRIGSYEAKGNIATVSADH